MYKNQYSALLFFCFHFFISVQFFAQPPVNQDPLPAVKKGSDTIHCIVMGDWGVSGSPNQVKVANAMAKIAAQLGVSYIIGTGDNFYPGGVKDIHDSHWKRSFEDVYNASSLQVPWFPVLGNHDYIQNPDAQVAYTNISNRWHMPARYYDTSFAIGNDSVLFVFLDTDPIEKMIRKSPNDNIKFPAGGVARQLKWLETVLSASKAKWKIVAGHHPLRTGGTYRHTSRTWKMKKKLQPIFKSHKVDAYLCGHDHHLEYLKPGGPTHYIVSGAAMSVGHIGWLKFNRKFVSKQKGFATLSITDESILLRFFNDEAQVIYQSTLRKVKSKK